VTPGTIRIGEPVTIDAVPLPLEDSLDLHSFRPEETADVVREYLGLARAAGFREVRIVHGRGRGVQRETVRRVLGGSAEVAGFADAPPERGGWGATVVRLADRPRPPPT
jgi:dsDNA-specific endonuclease/ATPase MutS2